MQSSPVQSNPRPLHSQLHLACDLAEIGRRQGVNWLWFWSLSLSQIPPHSADIVDICAARGAGRFEPRRAGAELAAARAVPRPPANRFGPLEFGAVRGAAVSSFDLHHGRSRAHRCRLEIRYQLRHAKVSRWFSFAYSLERTTLQSLPCLDFSLFLSISLYLSFSRSLQTLRGNSRRSRPNVWPYLAHRSHGPERQRAARRPAPSSVGRRDRRGAQSGQFGTRQISGTSLEVWLIDWWAHFLHWLKNSIDFCLWWFYFVIFFITLSKWNRWKKNILIGWQIIILGIWIHG